MRIRLPPRLLRNKKDWLGLRHVREEGAQILRKLIDDRIADGRAPKAVFGSFSSEQITSRDVERALIQIPFPPSAALVRTQGLCWVHLLGQGDIRLFCCFTTKHKHNDNKHLMDSL